MRLQTDRCAGSPGKTFTPFLPEIFDSPDGPRRKSQEPRAARPIPRIESLHHDVVASIDLFADPAST